MKEQSLPASQVNTVVQGGMYREGGTYPCISLGVYPWVYMSRYISLGVYVPVYFPGWSPLWVPPWVVSSLGISVGGCHGLLPWVGVPTSKIGVPTSKIGVPTSRNDCFGHSD